MLIEPAIVISHPVAASGPMLSLKCRDASDPQLQLSAQKINITEANNSLRPKDEEAAICGHNSTPNPATPRTNPLQARPFNRSSFSTGPSTTATQSGTMATISEANPLGRT